MPAKPQRLVLLGAVSIVISCYYTLLYLPLYPYACIAIVIYGLYRMLLASRRRASKTYFDRHKAEEELRRNDPDLRQDG